MKNIYLAIAAFALASASGGALAAPTAKSFGLNIDLTTPSTPLGSPSVFMLEGRYAFSKDMSVLAGIGLQMVDTGQATNNKATNIGLMGGIRKYLETNDYAPFFGGRLQYMTTRQGANDVTDFVLMAEFGAEYFLGKQFSLEGSVGAGYTSRKSEPVAAPGSTTATAFGTTTYNLSANYYF